MSDATITPFPVPRTDIPTTPGYYIERDHADLMPYTPVYRLYASGGWLLGGQQIPAAALPANLARLGIVA